MLSSRHVSIHTRNFAAIPRFRRAALAMAIAMPAALAAQPVVESERQARVSQLPQLNVVGDAEANVSRQTGAVSLVSSDDMESIQPRSTEEALKRVPGIHIKPEEESAIVANIGVRGISSADCVPVAPGLFVGNGRYYNPRIQRIDNIEVLKGSSALRYGPGNIGGVINYRTKEPQDGVALETSIGSWDTYKTTLELGGSSPS